MVKAVFWWCYMHLEEPATPDATLREMPTDEDIDLLRELYSGNPVTSMVPVKWGNGLTRSELHHSTAYPYSAE